MPPAATCLQVQRTGHVAVVTLDRPPANALSLAVLAELTAVTAELAVQPGVHTLVYTAAGHRYFCAGAEINGLAELDPAGGREINRRFQSTFDAIAGCPKPTICAVNGMALGGGLEWALACDVRIAAAGATFGLPEAALGLIPGGGGTQRLPRLVSPGKAKELMFSGRRIDSAEALRIGLVETVVPDGQALPEALALANRIAGGSPGAMAAIKAAVDRGLACSLADGLSLELEISAGRFGTPEAREGITAFLEKRKPRFAAEHGAN